MNSLTLLAALSLQPVFFGCLNSPLISTSLNGPTTVGHSLARHLEEAMEQTVAAKRPRLSNRADPQDLAVSAILEGDYARGIAMLTDLESAKPGDYNIAANLGTAYELSGDNTKALYWIQQGLKRNPRSHQGTEWLHVLILQAKQAADQGSAMPANERLLPLPTKNITKDTILSLHGQEYTAADVFTALSYQLQERMTFVKPEDRWVAECLYSLAILQAYFYSIADAREILSLAQKYGFPDLEHLKSQRTRLERSLFFAEVRHWSLLVIGAIAGITVLIMSYRKLRELLDT